MTNTNTNKTLSQKASELHKGETSGDWVLQSLPMSKDFSHVASKWIENGTHAYEPVLDDLKSKAAECSDIIMEPKTLRVSAGETLTTEHPTDASTLTFNRRGLETVCYWADLPQSIVGRMVASDVKDENGQVAEVLEHPEPVDSEAGRIFSELVNWGLDKKNRKDNFKVRLRGTDVRGVFSQKYAPVDNDWLMETLQTIIPGGRVSHYRSTGDWMSGIILIPDALRRESDSDYGGGIGFSNSEVGTSCVNVRPAVFRSICENGCIWDKVEGEGLEQIKRRHIGEIDLRELAREIYCLIESQIPLLNRCIDEMLDAKEIRLASNIDVLRFIRHAGGQATPKAKQKEWLKNWKIEGGDKNAFGLIQGLTRTARDTENGQGEEMERLAGTLCDWKPETWERKIAALDGNEETLARWFGEAEVSDLIKV